MSKKNWPVILGVSVLASVAGSLFFKGKKEKISEDKLINLENFYKGKWWFIDEHKKIQHQFEIQENFQVVIDGKSITGTIIELSKNKLVIRDQYGYHLIVTTDTLKPVSLYDEADDSTYPLSARI